MITLHTMPSWTEFTWYGRMGLYETQQIKWAFTSKGEKANG